MREAETDEGKPRRDQRHERIALWFPGNTGPERRIRRVRQSSESSDERVFGYVRRTTARGACPAERQARYRRGKTAVDGRSPRASPA